MIQGANTFLTATLLTLSLILSGCSALSSSTPEPAYQIDAPVLSKSATSFISQRLYLQHQEWHGTPYVWGGMSKRGVDCSGFVQLTLQQQFATRIPRTTAQQSQTGYAISPSELRAGDLVFFKTSSKGRHVGIYIENGRFLHASSSRGVMISRLDNVYWQKHYWHARSLR